MKQYIILAIALGIFSNSCKKSEFDSYLQTQDANNIVDVRIFSNSPVLIADGKAELKLLVRAYILADRNAKITREVNGVRVVKDTVFKDTVPLNDDRIPKDQITITASNGEQVQDNIFRTASGAGTTINFIAKIGNISSPPGFVRLTTGEAVDFSPITIPVIFHFLYPNGQQYLANGATTEFLDGILTRINKVFAGGLVNSPSSLDTKIQFVLATESPAGAILEEPGIDKQNIGTVTAPEMSDYILNNHVWDYNKYLNIWVCNAFALSVFPPRYILNNGSSVPGLFLEPVNDNSEAMLLMPEDVGMVIPFTNFFNMANATFEERYETNFGKFFGLIQTGRTTEAGPPYIDGDIDFCSDTYTYFSYDAKPEKWTFEPGGNPVIYYKSYNIMDQTSAASTISYEQALRIRNVIENCPFRTMHQ